MLGHCDGPGEGLAMASRSRAKVQRPEFKQVMIQGFAMEAFEIEAVKSANKSADIGTKFLCHAAHDNMTKMMMDRAPLWIES